MEADAFEACEENRNLRSIEGMILRPGAVPVFFMQAGFATAETGFIGAKGAETSAVHKEKLCIGSKISELYKAVFGKGSRCIRCVLPAHSFLGINPHNQKRLRQEK